jgi:hypothetical protein
MANPDLAPPVADRIVDMERQFACSLSKFALDMAYVDDLDADARSEVYAILHALEQDAALTRDQWALLADKGVGDA